MIINRLLLGFACLSVAWTCGERALGIIPQVLLGPSAVWLWWLAVVCWAVLAIDVIVRGAE